MPSGYPAAIDNFNNPTAVDNLSTAAVIHHTQHTNVNDAVKAIQTELGLTPKGTAATVKARLDALDVALTGKALAADEGAANGIAQLDAGSMLVQNLDAGKITTGTVAAARLPNLSGAKILGTASGGAAVPIDAIPAIDAGKTTTGIFAVARIPNLDAGKITTGTIPAARLPTTVTANANSRVVADIAARDAILLADRVDGMIVQVKTTNIAYVWRADNSTWWRMWDVQTNLTSVNENGAVSGAWTDISSLWFRAIGGQSYTFDAVIFAVCSGSSSVGVRYGMRWTGTGTMTFGGNGLQYPTNSPSINSDLKSVVITGDNLTPALPGTGFGLPAGSTVMTQVSGTYVCTASGDVWIQHVQNATDPTFPVTTVAGSSIKAFRVVPS